MSSESSSSRARSHAHEKEQEEPQERGAAGRAPDRRKPQGQAQETSAGGVVIRGEPGREQVVVIEPTRRAPSGARVLGLPKGHIDPGENALQAATREVREEAGVVVEQPLHDLGEVRYWYRRDGRTVSKSVVFFMFAYLSGETSNHDDEVVEARWIDLRDALTALSYEGEREMIARALAALDGGSAPVGSVDGAASGAGEDGVSPRTDAQGS
jgi:8-oxo-dGTP pyrophosphatase MutT (NUDIX family)